MEDFHDSRCIDYHLGDMATLIADRETEIIYELTQHVLGYSNELSIMAENISELDVFVNLTIDVFSSQRP